MWYYTRGQQTLGPVAWEELWRLAQQGQVQPSDFVVPAGQQNWRPASQIEGLFPAPNLPPLPEPESFSVRPGPDHPLHSAGPGADYGVMAVEPIPSGPGFWGICRRHLGRAFQWNLRNVEATPDEKAFLETRNLNDPTLQRYLVWRHSVLLVVMAPISLLALLGLVDVFTQDLSKNTGFGTLWMVLRALLPFAMPVAALIAMLQWYRPRRTYRVLRSAWLTATLGPLLLFLVPADWLVQVEALAEPGNVENARLGARLGLGIVVFASLWITLPVYLISTASGVQRACLRLKTLLPSSMVPGLFLAASAPIMPLMLLPFFVLISQLASNPLLILGMVTFTASPLVYLLFAKSFVQPHLHEVDFQRRDRLYLVVRILFWAGVGLLVLYALTRDIRIPNFNPGPGEPDSIHKKLLGFSEASSFLRPWSWQLLRWFLVELIGRSLFTMVLVSDLFMRVSSRVWTYEKDLAGSQAGRDNEHVMDMLHEGLQK